MFEQYISSAFSLPFLGYAWAFKASCPHATGKTSSNSRATCYFQQVSFNSTAHSRADVLCPFVPVGHASSPGFPKRGKELVLSCHNWYCLVTVIYLHWTQFSLSQFLFFSSHAFQQTHLWTSFLFFVWLCLLVNSWCLSLTNFFVLHRLIILESLDVRR